VTPPKPSAARASIGSARIGDPLCFRDVPSGQPGVICFIRIKKTILESRQLPMVENAAGDGSVQSHIAAGAVAQLPVLPTSHELGCAPSETSMP
jgi:hypothetical protein